MMTCGKEAVASEHFPESLEKHRFFTLFKMRHQNTPQLEIEHNSNP